MTSAVLTLPRPHEPQQRVMDDARRFNCVECGRRWGKTIMGENLIIQVALAGHPVAWFAPTTKFRADVWRDMLYTLESVITNVDKQEGRIELVTGGVIDFWTLHDNPNAGRGRKYKRVVIDEAAIVRGLQDAWTGAIRPTLTDLKGDAWFLSTPKGHNYFHKLWLRGQGDDPDWKSWRMGTIENPHISDSECHAPRGLPGYYHWKIH